MNDMKNYQRAMDKLRVSDRVKEDLFRELDAEQETRRIVKHSAWQKPAAAAAVAAVVGLNVFALMKLRSDVPVNPGNSQGDFEPVDVELPDLSEFGIDTSTFAQQQTPYTDSEQLDLTYRWEYTEEKPRENWTQYKNEAGALLVYDAQGRFRRFFNVPEIAEQLDSEPVEDAQQIDETILRFLQKTMPEQAFDPEEVYTIRTGSETGYENLGITQLSNGGWAKYTLNNDAEVCSVKVDLYDTPANSDFSIEEYNAAAEKLIGVIADDGTGEITDRRFVIFDGKILGMYQILLGERSNEGTEDEEVSYGNFGFLISPEYTLPEKPEETDQPKETEPNDILLPDLSAYGIDTAEFTLLNESQVPLDGEWFYEGEPQPQVKMTVFQNPAGDTITLDNCGRLISYQRKDTQPIPVSDTEERTALKKEIIQTLTSPDAVIWNDESTGGAYFNASYSWVHEVPANDGTTNATAYVRQIKALAFVNLAEDNSVQNIGIDYRIEPEQYQPYTDEALRLAELHYSMTDPHYTAQNYVDIDGVVYGVFTFETPEGTRELIARAPQVYSFEQYGIGGTYTKETQELFTLPGIWPYDDEPAPAILCDVYVSEANVKVWVDPQGRVIQYQAPDNLALSGPEYGLGQSGSMSQPLIKNLTRAAEANFSDWYEENNRFYNFLMADNSDMTTFAEAHVTMLKDLTLEYFCIDYLDWEADAYPDEEALKDYAAEAKRLGYIANLQYGWRITVNGETYGVFKQKGLGDFTGIRYTEDRVIVRLSEDSGIRADLSAFGIDTGEFTFDREDSVVPAAGDWFYDDAPAPTVKAKFYQNAAGDEIQLNTNGNFTEYTRNPAATWQQGASIGEQNAHERMRDIAAAAAVQGDSSADLSMQETQFNAGPSENGVTDWRHYYGAYYNATVAGKQATVFVELAQDGTLQTIALKYTAEPEDTASYLAEAERLSQHYDKPQLFSQEYCEISGAVYGLFSYATGTGEHTLIVRGS